MKTIKFIIILAITFFALSCKKDNKEKTEDIKNQKILTMKVNGIDWVGNENLVGMILKSNNKANFGGGNTLTNETLNVNNIEVLSNGTYNIDPVLIQNVTFLKDGSVPKLYQVKTDILASRFTFTVTKTTDDKIFTKIKGTFSGVLYASASDSVVITNGVYNFN